LLEFDATEEELASKEKAAADSARECRNGQSFHSATDSARMGLFPGSELNPVCSGFESVEKAGPSLR
jgi:hypothetical protein